MSPRLPRLGIRARFALSIGATVLVAGLALSAFVHGTVSNALEAELHERALALISELVERATPEAVRSDTASLQLVVDDLATRKDVAYAVIVGSSGRVLASSFPSGLPRDLARLFEQPRPSASEEIAFLTEQGEIHDHVGLLIDGRLGTAHIGLDQTRIQRQAIRQSHLVLAHTMGATLTCASLAFLIAHLATRPLRKLAAAIRTVGTDQPVPQPAQRRRDEIGQLARAFAAMLERLEQKQAQVDAANRLVVQAERMAVVGQLASGVAHEIGNPLHAGRQFLSSLREDPDQHARYVDLLDQALGRIDRVISQLLSYAGERALEPVLGDPAELVRQTIDFMRYDHRIRTIDVELDLPADLPMALLDPSTVQQVLVNLAVNALDAMAGAGTLTIRGRAVEHQGRAMVSLTVADDGPGVPAEIAERLFDPFFTTKEPGKGTGLGLSVSQELMAAQGGFLRHLPGEGPWATFEILLPVREDA